MKPYNDPIFLFGIILATVLLFLCLACSAQEPSDDEDLIYAIYKAEGGEKAVKPYGILSVPCDTKDECRQICLNTVRNNRRRYADYGYKKYDTYLEFLASRYAPIGATNDPRGLNKNWLKNVKYFLNRRRDERD